MTEEIKSNVEKLELYSDTFPFRLSLRIKTFENESNYKRFVHNTEMLIRRCYEYTLWRNYIIDVLQINECMITHESVDQVTIDVHHHIPSLYVLVSALVNRHLEEEIEFCTFDIAQEALELHFKNNIGYLTLLKSMHEKFHNGHLHIPISFVKGNYQYFLERFSKYIDDKDLEHIERLLSINEHNCSWSRDNYPVALEAF